ncbi:hypothetical protein [Aridibaculum aurantiacum]|uniref:hypothetical protein n=1 Tax=Aridibaculum aurantiacum TaxID=2810307 RepID=UPI001A97AD56|nr:hypothetical protein [Aridibaculum aurantiacum]
MEQVDLMKNIRDFFISQYAIKNNSSRSFVAFEPLAHMISPDDFGSDPTRAADHLSRLCDKVPQVNDVFIADGTRTLSGTYGELIASAQFSDKRITGDPTPYIGLWGNLKSLADRLYNNGARASTEDGGTETIYLTRATPANWYDANSSIWTRKTITKTTTQTVPGRGVGNKQPPIINSKLVWKESVLDTKLVQNSNIINIVKNPLLVDKINLATKPVAAKPNAAEPVTTTIGSTHLNTAAIAGSARLMKKPGMMTAEKVTAKPVVNQVFQPINMPVAHATLQLNKVPTINRQVYKAMNVVVPFQQKVLLNRAVGRIDNSTTQEVKSTDFQLDFSYTLVSLDRPWMAADVIDNANLWYALTRKAGYYSTGEVSAENNGAIRAIPKAMIVIKDLSIKAQWTEADRKEATTSIGLGCFNLANSSFSNTNELNAPGVMILGWVCEVLPKLPANDDTSFN